MTRQIVENLELFSEAQLEALEFLPEELENIESELYPNLESISLEEVAKDLEAYFEGGVEQAGLEARGRSRGGRGGAPSGGFRDRFRRGGRGGAPGSGIRDRFRRGARIGGGTGSDGTRALPNGSRRPTTAEKDQIRTIRANITGGTLGGGVYSNEGGHGSTRLPRASTGEHYREYRLGQDNHGGAGAHRAVILIGSDGRSVAAVYYTSDHYQSFFKLS
ncbi:MULTISPECIES: ribonuclease domain-containing protein [unclassified Tolypothrix]|uniref:ribonuclease domain-containing protein n=1 Tax=unclassified Tolypothrix TaxID=2649714 RepID=UPI000B619763|nr:MULTISPECIES: ribonuclease domain-containing protein [unclassified Tolypothrix]MBE9083509.1 hypothetical protein [Tolypothrix sp. LEGE 11397]UYD30883.1 hypothetical protein HGR01_39040 [Tolypothrix sp. PCC 7712]BAY95684.1 hypothetical protein NIES3275_77610 [Microchaete diplosiphon NIES-3275]